MKNKDSHTSPLEQQDTEDFNIPLHYNTLAETTGAI